MDIKQMPDEKRVADAIGYYHRMWQQAHDQWADYDSFYQLEFDVWDERQFRDRPSYRRSRPRNLVDHAVDTQMIYHPNVKRDTAGEAGDAQERTDRLRDGLAAVIRESSLREMSLPWRMAAKYLTHYGYFVFEAPILDGRLMQDRIDARKRMRNETDEEFENRQRDTKASSWNPIRINVPHPTSVLMDVCERDPDEAIKIEAMPAYRVLELSEYKKKSRKNSEVYRLKNQDPSSPVIVQHYWSRYWHAVRAASGEHGSEPQMLYVEKNGMRMLPFLHTLAGFGMEPVNGTGNPRHSAVGILHGVRDSLRAQSQGDSAKHNLLMRKSFVGMRTSGSPEELRDQLRGGIAQAEEGEIGILPTPDVDRAMFEIGREQAEDIEEGTYSRSLGGVRIPGVTTVGQQAAIQTAAGKKFVETVTQITHLSSEIGRRILRLVDTSPTLSEGIGAYGHVIRRSDIQGNYNVDIMFEDIDPVIKLQQQEVDMRQVQLNLMSHETYLDRHAQGTVSEEMDRLYEDEVMQNPNLRAELARQAARRLGLGEEYGSALGQQAEQLNADGRRTAFTRGPERGSTENLRDLPQGITPDVPTPPRGGMV